MDETDIRTLVTRSDLDAVVAWILARGGKPEATATATAPRGLHHQLSSGERTQASTPLRYVLPAGSLS
jgi:hypothetical protein